MNTTEDYEYIIDPDILYEYYTELKIKVPIFSVIFVVGLVGNLLVIYAVVKSKRLHNAPCLLLANLAVADLFTIVVLLPLLLTRHLLLDEEISPWIKGWTIGPALCRLQPYILITPPVCSIFTMITISIERYYVVLHPLRAKSLVTMGRVKKVIIGIWVTSCILTIPALFDKKLHRFYYVEERLRHVRGTHMYLCLNAWLFSRRFSIAYNAYLFLLVFFIPLIIVCYIYIRIGVHLNRTRKGVGNSKYLPVRTVACRDSSGWSSASPMTTQTQNVTSEDETVEMDTLRSVPSRAEDDSSAPRRHRRSNEGDNIQRVIKVLAVVVAFFIITWGPIMTHGLVCHLFPECHRFKSYSYIYTPLLNLLAACNSCINPIIYAFMSKTFRQSFKEVIRGCCCSSPLSNNAE